MSIVYIISSYWGDLEKDLDLLKFDFANLASYWGDLEYDLDLLELDFANLASYWGDLASFWGDPLASSWGDLLSDSLLSLITLGGVVVLDFFFLFVIMISSSESDVELQLLLELEDRNFFSFLFRAAFLSWNIYVY